MTVNERIKLARKLAGMTQDDLSEALERTVRTVQRLEKKGESVTLRDINLISEATGKPVSWFYGEVQGEASAEGFPPSVSPGPRVSDTKKIYNLSGDIVIQIPTTSIELSAGPGTVAESEYFESEFAINVQQFYSKTGINPRNLYRARVTGDSMEPTLKAGDIVYLIPSTNEGIIDGAIYGIRYNDDVMIKRLYLKENRRVLVRSDNPVAPSFEINLADQRIDFHIGGRFVMKDPEYL